MTSRSPAPALTMLRLPLCLLPAAGPVGLVIYVVSGVSLPVAAALVAVVGIVAWLVAVGLARRSHGLGGALLSRIRHGAGAGLVATIAYDAGRYGLVALARLSIRPFRVWRLFGTLFVPHASVSTAYAVGFAYHLANGVGLGVAYRLLVKRPTLRNGIVWAFVLELAMALLYPAWLRITALGEFLTVSVFGHAIYGAVLALSCRRLGSRSGSTRPSPVGAS